MASTHRTDFFSLTKIIISLLLPKAKFQKLLKRYILAGPSYFGSSNEGSGKSTHMYSLTSAYAAAMHKVGT